MAKFYHVDIPQDYNDWMSLITNSELYAERAKDLKECSEAINAALTTHEKHQDIDAALAQAKSKLTEAEAIRKQADDYFETIKAKADKEVEQLESDRLSFDQVRIDSVKAHEKRFEEIKMQNAALDARQASLDKFALLIKDEANAAKTHYAEAVKLKATYEERLAKLKAAVGE